MYNFYLKNCLHPPFSGRMRKLLLIMKLTTLILITVILHVSAATLAQKVTLKAKNAPLIDIFNQISTQTGYDFAFTTDALKDTKPVTIDVKNEELSNVLQQIFRGQNLDFSLDNKIVVIKPKETSVFDNLKNKIKAEFAQVVVSGKVNDELGNPMVGVTVKQKETNNATATDSKGTYTLTVPDNNTIISFSFIGFETVELAAKDIPTGSVITLKAVATNLREVAVNKGYYREKGELSTGAVSRVTAKEIEEQPVSDLIQALIGRVPGLNIAQASGVPGAYAKIHIRGINSIANGDDPLYIIDGVPFSSVPLSNSSIGSALGVPPNGAVSNGINAGGGVGMSPFNALNPADIEDIQVLKDADATSLYGSRGANGVILITTKKGKAGPTKVDITALQGVGQVIRMMDLLNTQQYLQMRHEAFKNDGLAFPSITTNPSDFNYDVNGAWDTTRYTNWQKLLIGNTAQYTNIQANISGGTANTQFLIGAGYNRQTTVYPGDYGDKKGSIHISLTHASSNQKFHVQFTANYVNDNSNIPNVDYTNSITLAPDAPALYNLDGSLNWQIINGSSTFFNPLSQTLVHSTAITNNLISNLNLDYEVLPGLKLSTVFGYTRDEMNQNNARPASSLAPPDNTVASNRSDSYATATNENWNIEPTISYRKKIAKGQLDAVFGTTFLQTSTNSMGETARGFASDALLNNPASASTFQLLNYTNTLYRYNAVYARVGYNWEEKYVLNLTARRDGSSRFGPGKQFGDFGAIGANWIFSKEKFVSNTLPFLSFGKLRASYGTTGNDQIPPYQYLSSYTSVSTTYQGITALNPARIANPNFAWEVQKKLDIALELGFLNDRVNLSADYFRDRSGNQLVGYPLPFISGFTSFQYNLPAVVQNSGLELSLNTINIKSVNFNWTSTANLTIPQNKLVAFPGLANTTFGNSYIIGQPTLIVKLPGYTGVDPQTGVYTFATANANGIPSQQEYVPNLISQKFYGGVGNNFTYKQFQLDFFIQFVKQTGRNVISNFSTAGSSGTNEPTAVLARWQKPGDVTTVGKFSTQFAQDPNIILPGSNAGVGDASFIRLKNVSLSYNLPKQLQQWAKIQNARVFLQAQNLLTLTNYLGVDPETQGLITTLPPLRMITLGISASL